MIDLIYNIVFEGVEIDTSTAPAYVIAASRELIETKLYSEDFPLIGYRTLSVQAILPYANIRRRML